LRPLLRHPATLVLAALLWAGASPALAASSGHAGLRTTGAQKPQGYLGIEFHDLSDEQVAALHLHGPRGAEIAMVDHDGPAGHAGLRAHDVVVAVNGVAIDSALTLRRLIHDAGAGVLVAIEVLRNGRAMTLNATLANREDVERSAMARLAANDPPPAPPVSPLAQGFADHDGDGPSRTQAFLNAMLHMSPFTGLAMESMVPQLAQFFGAPQGAGLLVHTVMPDSPAAAAGLRAGDVVLRADGVLLKSTADWTRRLRAAKGHALTLTVLRDKREQTMVLTPDLKRRSEGKPPALWPLPARLAA